MPLSEIDLSVANDGLGTPLRTAGGFINDMIGTANNGQLQGFKNKFANGNFAIAQRGATHVGMAAYAVGLDRWMAAFGGGGATSVDMSQVVIAPGDAALPDSVRYACRYVPTGGSGSGWCGLAQDIEDVRASAGRTVTVSGYIRAQTALTISAQFSQRFGSGGSGTVNHNATDTNVTTVWTPFSITKALNSVTGKTIGAGDFLRVMFRGPLTGSDWIEYADVQFEYGAISTPFESRDQAVELAMCQRFYQSKTVQSENGARHIPLASMRAAPSIVVGVGSAANITPDGFELTHTAAAACTVTADAGI
jgi:hypothetical protein